MSFTSTKEEHGCQVCKTVPDIVGTVSKSWYQDYFDAQLLFFVEVDLVNPKNGAIFQVAQVTTVPQIVIIPPSSDKELHEDGSNQQLPLGYRMLREPRTVFQLPKDEIRKQSLALAQFVSEAVQKRITIREEDPQLAFLKNFFITLVIILVIKKKGSQYVLVTRKSAWCAVCIILVGLFVSGYSFTTMNGIAFLVQNDKGGLIYFSGGQLYQFGIEIFLVATNYILLGGALVLLIYMGQYKVTKDSRINSELTRFVLILGANVLILLNTITKME
ncbi:ER oligosaccharyltransferase complex subunit [Scheffersomyces spartinae]|uniref:ER oligosaccharyltransferase complex subunit n=1 Tax=Scheffersomyces spartinae TaxID=45513 RepID=A0A9P8AJA7_9ASCO|nr:ER oligosaccharyltransferase complex subunit [Scheffersomyces spartinae]KAG7194565.1 ER oligosaccharyltransferase complex subunit [Scheffersomyces spartinae]